MRRIERLYAISERLRRASPATVPARLLAEEFGVARRTIERDLDSLRLAGAPVFGQPGRRGGTGSLAQPRRIVALDHTEIVSLIVAAGLGTTAPYATAASMAIGKLLDALDGPQRAAVEELRGRFRVAAPDSAATPRVRSVVEDAVGAQTVVRLAYTDRNGQRTVRRVEPVGFYTAEGIWSLVAWCRLREGGRLFQLDRITRAHPTSERFAPRDLDEVLGWVPQPGRRP